MRVKLILLAACAAFTAALLIPGAAHPAPRTWKSRGEGGVIQRIIRIEGTLEKPRVIFIVPRSRLREGGFLDKSFLDDILAPVRPESLTTEGEEYTLEGGRVIWKR